MRRKWVRRSHRIIYSSKSDSEWVKVSQNESDIYSYSEMNQSESYYYSRLDKAPGESQSEWP